MGPLTLSRGWGGGVCALRCPHWTTAPRAFVSLQLAYFNMV